MTYNFWFALGQFFAPVALQVMSTYAENNWLTPVLTQWSQIGLMLIIYLIVPETPAWAASRGKEERAKKSLRWLYRGVKDYDVDHQYRLIAIAVEHEAEQAAATRQEHWYAIFKGTDGKRTITALWTLMTQQFIGLTLFSTFASYFFLQAGIEDPFLATCITNGINIAAGLIVIASADKVGRRLISCSGSTLSWLACCAVGILGVAPRGTATNYLFVFFAVLWSKSIPSTHPQYALLTKSLQISAWSATALQVGVSSARSPPSACALTQLASPPPPLVWQASS